MPFEQVQTYIAGVADQDRQSKERLAGVAFDGSYFIFVRFRDGRWRIDDPIVVDEHSTRTFLRYLLSLSTELPLTPENLVKDFGDGSRIARACVSRLFEALNATQSERVHVLFRQWLRQFQEVTGYGEDGQQLSGSDLAKLYGLKEDAPPLQELFFAIHTYYALFIKLLALQVAHFFLMPKIGTALSSVASYDQDRLKRYLAELERGGLFAQLGIRNFLEGDFFGWYLSCWT